MVKFNDNPTLRFRMIAYAFTLSHDNRFHPGGTPDSSDGDERKEFLGFEIFDSGICWVEKFGKYFLG